VDNLGDQTTFQHGFADLGASCEYPSIVYGPLGSMLILFLQSIAAASTELWPSVSNAMSVPWKVFGKRTHITPQPSSQGQQSNLERQSTKPLSLNVLEVCG
jgi:hypothetical protein